MTYSNNLALEIQNHYKVGPRFTKAYLECRPPGNFETIQEVLNAPPPLPMWFDFAMSTNSRGQTFIETISQYLPPNAHRYLDVGCGYGGFLVAFANEGFEVCGIDIDPLLVDLSIANCLDNELKNCVYQASILDTDLVDRFGTFDVITCNDVIEHVLDVQLAIQNMVGLLNNNGIIAFEIPNKYSVSFVKSDGHFSLFGITLLKRSSAIRYHNSFFTKEYDVGYYYELPFYQQELKKHGCKTLLLPSHQLSIPKKQIFFHLWQGYKKYKADLQKRLPINLDLELHFNFISYLFMLSKDLLAYKINSDAKNQYFNYKYLVDFWYPLARKVKE